MAKRKTKAQLEAEEMARFKAESDVRTLREAEAVKNDPARMAQARKLAREEQEALKKISAGGKKKARKKR